jgi:polyisoprenoid-binding protein YceI
MKPLILSLSLLFALHVASAQALFKIVPGRSGNEAQFKSDAPMETVVGTAHTLTGFVELDPASDGTGARGEVHVDLTSLKTGIELRDRHMRENHLETDTYPETVFILSSITLPAGGLRESERTRVTVNGTLRLHGVEHQIQPETYITLGSSGSGSSLHVESSFVVSLPDYQIKRPQFLVMRLAEEQRINVEFTAVSNTSVAIESK